MVVRTASLSRLQSSRGWSGMPRSFGVLPSAGQSVLLLTASLFVAPEPPREVRHGTVVWPDYGGETSQQRQGAHRAEKTGSSSGSPDPWAATAKIGSSAWAEGRVLGVVTVRPYDKMLEDMSTPDDRQVGATLRPINSSEASISVHLGEVFVGSSKEEMKLT
ncbi:hypothetical protein Taro_004829, partial [Colocasia esculenta]|nr:hypothetical protein [Colocasia esculenta]